MSGEPARVYRLSAQRGRQLAEIAHFSLIRLGATHNIGTAIGVRRQALNASAVMQRQARRAAVFTSRADIHHPMRIEHAAQALGGALRWRQRERPSRRVGIEDATRSALSDGRHFRVSTRPPPRRYPCPPRETPRTRYRAVRRRPVYSCRYVMVSRNQIFDMPMACRVVIAHAQAVRVIVLRGQCRVPIEPQPLSPGPVDATWAPGLRQTFPAQAKKLASAAMFVSNNGAIGAISNGAGCVGGFK